MQRCPDLLEPHAETKAVETRGVQSFELDGGAGEAPSPADCAARVADVAQFSDGSAPALVSIDFFAVPTPTDRILSDVRFALGACPRNVNTLLVGRLRRRKPRQFKDGNGAYDPCASPIDTRRIPPQDRSTAVRGVALDLPLLSTGRTSDTASARCASYTPMPIHHVPCSRHATEIVGSRARV